MPAITPNNVDDILVMGTPMPAPEVDNQAPVETADTNDDTPQYDDADIKELKADNVEQPEQKVGEPEDEVNPYVDEQKEEAQSEVKAEAPAVDEYGNETAKPRMYSEEDVQRMIRDRLSRGSVAQQQSAQQTQQVQQAAKDFQADPNSQDSWEVQLENFVEKTFNKMAQKQQQEQAQQIENQRRAEFDTKFTTGMSKYGDFVDVVKERPITDAMLMATRSLENPAAFIYAAAKLQGAELDRISKINDPYQQAAEMGRLEERMRKSKAVTKAPRLVKSDRTDIVEKPDPKKQENRNIDGLIEKHARSKVVSRR